MGKLADSVEFSQFHDSADDRLSTVSTAFDGVFTGFDGFQQPSTVFDGFRRLLLVFVRLRRVSSIFCNYSCPVFMSNARHYSNAIALIALAHDTYDHFHRENSQELAPFKPNQPI